MLRLVECLGVPAAGLGGRCETTVMLLLGVGNGLLFGLGTRVEDEVSGGSDEYPKNWGDRLGGALYWLLIDVGEACCDRAWNVVDEGLRPKDVADFGVGLALGAALLLIEVGPEPIEMVLGRRLGI
jgi:hypothetical protein